MYFYYKEAQMHVPKTQYALSGLKLARVLLSTLLQTILNTFPPIAESIIADCK
jgi:hypothetical protein